MVVDGVLGERRRGGLPPQEALVGLIVTEQWSVRVRAGELVAAEEGVLRLNRFLLPPQARGAVVAGEFDDSALMFWFGRTGAGIFPAPTVIESDIRREMGVKLVGEVREVRESFYAITLEEKPKHPAVAAICGAAARRQNLMTAPYALWH